MSAPQFTPGLVGDGERSLTDVRCAIREIDKLIDRNRALGPPDKHERECALFRERGELQLTRNRLEFALSQARPLFKRQKKCPHCRGSGYARGDQ